MLSSLKHKKGSNLIFVLSDESRNILLDAFPPAFDKVACYHTVVIANPSAGQLQKYKSAHPKDPEVCVTGFVTNDSIECFTVSVAEDHRRKFGDGGMYHIVLSTNPPSKPSDVAKLLKDLDARRATFEIPIKISGTFELP